MRRLSHSFPRLMRRGTIGCLLVLSCSQAPHRFDFTPQEACTLLDSLYRSALLPMPYSISGKARFDVNQYRLRGTFQLSVYPPGDSTAVSPDTATGGAPAAYPFRQVFDFASSSYFGSQREDMTISMTDGDIWILDRERGEYYEGEEANRFIRERLDISGNFSDIIGLATGCARPCELLRRPSARPDSRGELEIRGLVGGQEAAFRFGPVRRRVREITWPLEVQPGRMEKLRISYAWSKDGEALEGIQLLLESLSWQIKLTVAGDAP